VSHKLRMNLKLLQEVTGMVLGDTVKVGVNNLIYIFDDGGWVICDNHSPIGTFKYTPMTVEESFHFEAWMGITPVNGRTLPGKVKHLLICEELIIRTAGSYPAFFPNHEKYRFRRGADMRWYYKRRIPDSPTEPQYYPTLSQEIAAILYKDP